jgi:hypothetical protein
MNINEKKINQPAPKKKGQSIDMGGKGKKSKRVTCLVSF